MKFPLGAILPELQEAMAKGREAVAARQVAPEVVRTKITEAAKLGHGFLRIAIPENIDIRQTEAAAALMTWAAKVGLLVTWERRFATLPDGRQIIVHEPELTWEKPKSI